jgi:hypothetical protein
MKSSILHDDAPQVVRSLDSIRYHSALDLSNQSPSEWQAQIVTDSGRLTRRSSSLHLQVMTIRPYRDSTRMAFVETSNGVRERGRSWAADAAPLPSPKSTPGSQSAARCRPISRRIRTPILPRPPELRPIQKGPGELPGSPNPRLSGALPPMSRKPKKAVVRVRTSILSTDNNP